MTVSTIADSLQEGDEQFFLILTDGTGTVVSSATVIIRDVGMSLYTLQSNIYALALGCGR